MREIISRQRVTTILTHLLCIIILIILPEFLSNLANPGRPLKMWMYAKTFIYIGVFYINYYWIIERSLYKPRGFIRLIAYNILVIAISLGIIYAIWRFRDVLGAQPPHRRPPMPPNEGIYLAKSIGMLSRDLVMLILVIGFATALRLSDKWLTLERRRKDLINAQHEEELKNLKSQLNPHFLFNTLNSIYALIAISPDKAQSAVHELSRLLRYVLYDTSTTVPLNREINFIDNYISLMKLRLNPDIRLLVNLASDSDDSRQIAPLLFITLIENVFKHGIHTPETPIEISVTTTDNEISCQTSNGYIDDEKSSSEGGGIGLTNLRRRLDLIYGDNARLDVETSPDDHRFTVTLTISNQSTKD